MSRSIYNDIKLSLTAVALITLYFYPFKNATGQTEIGISNITNYTYKDYDAHLINWWVEEDDRGVLYFANRDNILEFDGASWRQIERSNARSFAKDSSGTMFAGGSGDFGYLKPDDKGVMQYISLLDKVPQEHKVFEEVWETDFYQGRIIFRTVDKLYCWDGENFTIITSDNGYHVGKIVNDKYYLRIWNKGLCVMEADTFRVVPGGEQFADSRIYSILPYDDQRLLIGTRVDGMFIYDGKTFTPFKTEADQYIEGSLYLPGIALSGGRFLLNTFSNGAYIINRDGKLLNEFSNKTGLQDNGVDYVFEDSKGTIWMALFNGISKVDLNSEFTYFTEYSGLPSTIIFVMQRHNGILYVGGNNAVYYYDQTTNKFKQVEGSFGQVTDLKIINDKLYGVSNGMGMFELIDAKVKYVRKSINYDFRAGYMHKSKFDTNRVYVFHQDGMSTMYPDPITKDFIEESRVGVFSPDPRRFIENEDGTFFIHGLEEKTVRLVKPGFTKGVINLDESSVEVLDSTHGIEGNVGLGMVKDVPGIFFNETFHTYDKENDTIVEAHSWIIDTLQALELEVTGIPHVDELDRLWLSTDKGLHVFVENEDGTKNIISKPFAQAADEFVSGFYVEPVTEGEEVTVWIFTADGISRYIGNLKDPDVSEINVFLRKIEINGDSLIYGGAGINDHNYSFTSKDNSVNIEYASPFYINEAGLEYQTFVDGLDKEWSDWSNQSAKEYLNLSSGSYTFNVKARNFGIESEAASFKFNIAPPWYATWWAYLLYLSLLSGLIYYIVRSRTARLRAKQKELEFKVIERTKEVQKRVDELATINKVSQALTEKLEIKDLVQLVGEQMKNIFKANITYVAIHDPLTNMINFPYQDGDVMQPMEYGDGLTSQILQSGKSALINEDIRKEYEKLGIDQIGKNASSYLGVPIPVEGKMVGVISVQSTELENRFDESDMSLLTTIAQNVGVALHNAELYEEATTAKAQAEDANEAKSAFLSTVSHELRTPLTSVLGFAKIIRKRLEDKIFPAVQVDDQKIKRTMKQVTQNLDVVVSEGERLTNLINDVLDLAKIESGKMDWNIKPIFLQDVINRAITATSALFDQKQLTLNKTIPADLPMVNGDQDKLIQVVINLLSNSVKFTDKGSVNVEAYVDKDQITVEIQDTGIGIAVDDHHKVFEKFRQAGDTLTDKPKGTGLGLPICREIVEYHGGIIWMKSEHKVGSSFFFSIPIIGADGNAHPVQLDNILKSLKKQINRSSLVKPDAVSTILVVDDDTPIRSLLRQELSEAGYQVREATNGKEALDAVRYKKPDLILLDVMMPEINGFDVAAVLKNDPDTMDIPIIILSIVHDHDRGFKIGVDRYLTKPIDTEKLFREVDILLEQGVSKKKVLVFDEDESAVKTLSEVLQTRGYNVLESSGKDILETAMNSKPDIIMLNSNYNKDQELIKALKFEKGLENVLFFVYQ